MKKEKEDVKTESLPEKVDENQYNPKTSKVLKEAVEDAIAVLSVCGHKNVKNLMKQPNIDDDVEKLMHKFLEEAPDQMPQEGSCSFGSFEDMQSPHGYSNDELNKMLRRWHRSGFLTGYYRTISRKKLNESQKSTSSNLG